MFYVFHTGGRKPVVTLGADANPGERCGSLSLLQIPRPTCMFPSCQLYLERPLCLPPVDVTYRVADNCCQMAVLKTPQSATWRRVLNFKYRSLQSVVP